MSVHQGGVVNSFERFVFRDVPVWGVGLLLIGCLVGTIIFSNIAVHTFKGGKRAGAAGDAILAVSNIPDFIKSLDATNEYLRIRQDLYGDRQGMNFSYPANSRPDAGYLLLSYYDGDQRRSVIELWDLNAQSRLHTWLPPINEINERSTEFSDPEIILNRDRDLERYIIRHPVVTANGDVVIKSRTPMARIDACDQIVWINQENLYHHATEMDSSETFWVSAKFATPTIPNVNRADFLDDAIAAIGPDGELKFMRSISAVMLTQDMERYVYGRESYNPNPIHLNDIQPVEEDGPYWKAGDLFLSMRSNSMIALYRPSEDRIVWFKEGPWSHQHDVDILDDHRISIFDNNSFEGGRVRWIDGHSDVKIYDFATDEVSSPWSETLSKMEMSTETEGLKEITPVGEIMIEEQNHGRIFMLDADQALLWEFVNRGSDNALYRTAWSRLLSPDFGAEVAAAVSAKDCTAGADVH